MRRIWLISLVLFLATLAVFSRVLVADFVQWDDGISVYQNPHIQGLDWTRLRWMFSDASYAMRYKPLTWLTYALVFQLGGLKPFGYHLVNLLIHCLNAVLAFGVIRRLLATGIPGQSADERLAEATLPAAGGALLWAINPLRVEPVARVTDLTFCLLTCFLLISLWCYLRATVQVWGARPPRALPCGALAGWLSGVQAWLARAPSTAPVAGALPKPEQLHLRACDSQVEKAMRSRFYWGSVAAFALAMFSYPFAFAYGVVLLVLDWYPLGRFAGCAHWWRDARARKVLLEKVPFLLLGGTMLTTIAARFNPTGIWAGLQVDSGFSPFARAMQAFYVWAYYVWKPWLPFHLSPLYTTLVGFNPNSWPFWLSAALVIATTVLLVRRRNQWPWALALWISYLVLVLPALGLTERPHFTADRYDYLPGLVWAVAIAAALRWVAACSNLRCPNPWKPGQPATVPSGALEDTLAPSDGEREGVRGPTSIRGCYSRILSPRATGITCVLVLALVWGGLSAHQTRIWRNSVALFEYMIGELKDDPSRADIHWRLGTVLASQGKTREAAQHYQTSLHLQPAVKCYLSFAELLEQNGDRQGALTNCLAALALGPTPVDHAKAGEVFAALGRGAEAINQYRVALASVPDLVPALNNLAWVLATDRDAKNRNGSEAVRLAERACALTDHQIPVLMGTLAAAYAEAGNFKEAIETAQKARDLAQAAGQSDVAEKNRQLLELYKSGRAYRQPLPGVNK